jgi:hypothetical protein
MYKIIPLVFATSVFALSPINSKSAFVNTSSQFNTSEKSDGSYAIESVKPEYLDAEELRIYGSDFLEKIHYSEVKPLALQNANFERIMISKDVEIFSPSLEGKTVYYTGTQEEFEQLGIVIDEYTTVLYEACDEGFINFWYENIRTFSSICDVILEQNKPIYEKLMTLYNQLDITGDKDTINNYNDGSSTIKESIDYIQSLINPSPEPSKPKEMSQDMMLYFVLAVASIGMTSICIFYLLKDKNIID